MKKNHRGEIATIVTLAVIVVIGVTTVISSIFLQGNKKQSTGTKAAEPTSKSECENMKGWWCVPKCELDQTVHDSFKGTYGGPERDEAKAYAGWKNEAAKALGHPCDSGGGGGGSEPTSSPTSPPQSGGGNTSGDYCPDGGVKQGNGCDYGKYDSGMQASQNQCLIDKSAPGGESDSTCWSYAKGCYKTAYDKKSQNDDGSWGPCHYFNAAVCRRGDMTGGCAGVCNSECCSGGQRVMKAEEYDSQNSPGTGGSCWSTGNASSPSSGGSQTPSSNGSQPPASTQPANTAAPTSSSSQASSTAPAPSQCPQINCSTLSKDKDTCEQNQSRSPCPVKCSWYTSPRFENSCNKCAVTGTLVDNVCGKCEREDGEQWKCGEEYIYKNQDNLYFIGHCPVLGTSGASYASLQIAQQACQASNPPPDEVRGTVTIKGSIINCAQAAYATITRMGLHDFSGEGLGILGSSIIAGSNIQGDNVRSKTSTLNYLVKNKNHRSQTKVGAFIYIKMDNDAVYQGLIPLEFAHDLSLANATGESFNMEITYDCNEK